MSASAKFTHYIYQYQKQNNMNEDFIPFELAVKLKEKGFNELCLAYYTNDDTLYYNYSHKSGACYKDCYLSHNLMPKDSVSGKFVDAPTISQVLKWLREKYSIHISTKPYPCEDGIMWMYEIRKFSIYKSVVVANKTGFIKEEEAAVAGTESVLDILI